LAYPRHPRHPWPKRIPDNLEANHPETSPLLDEGGARNEPDTTRPMNPFKFSCPHCDQHLQCDEQFSGREIQCPNCNHLIRIPPVPGHAAQYDPESGKTWNTFMPTGTRPSELPQKGAEGSQH
jgi:hypothetical protein